MHELVFDEHGDQPVSIFESGVAHYLRLKSGEPFSMVFDEAAGGGYEWNIASSNAGFPISRTRKPGLKTADDVGSNVRAEFNGTTNEPGIYDITFEHKRPWEQVSADSVRVKLTVQ